MEGYLHFLWMVSLKIFQIKNVKTLQVGLVKNFQQLQRQNLLQDYQQFFSKFEPIFLKQDLSKLIWVKILQYLWQFRTLLMKLLRVFCFFYQSQFKTEDHKSASVSITQSVIYENHFEIFATFVPLQIRFIISPLHSESLCLLFTLLLSTLPLAAMSLVNRQSLMPMVLIRGHQLECQNPLISPF